MSEELKIVKAYLFEKIKGLEEKQSRDRSAVEGAKKTMEWRQKRINGFKTVLEGLI